MITLAYEQSDWRKKRQVRVYHSKFSALSHTVNRPGELPLPYLERSTKNLKINHIILFISWISLKS